MKYWTKKETMSFILINAKIKYSHSGHKQILIDSTQLQSKILKRGKEASLAMRESLVRQYNEKRLTAAA